MNAHVHPIFADVLNTIIRTRTCPRCGTPWPYGPMCPNCANVNQVQAALEARSAAEFDDLDEPFIDWLRGPHGSRCKQDYIDFRCAMADDDERREIKRGLDRA